MRTTQPSRLNASGPVGRIHSPLYFRRHVNMCPCGGAAFTGGIPDRVAGP
ncbi:MAG: hypothetical protein MZV64_24010 [Ignavibacteriales bacterium]|nr:hypothetical protein [Ignavibacteriales bacterium]